MSEKYPIPDSRYPISCRMLFGENKGEAKVYEFLGV